MMAGKLDAAGMDAIAGPRQPPSRPQRTVQEQRIAALEHQVAVLRACLDLAIGELAFERLPTSRIVARQIQRLLCEAGIPEITPRTDIG